ncbi:class I SAM-dependent methyltransferase [Parafrankia colletiae]|nr:class I SAM-dependent methyltransferase [Parafrankia colletiae]
MRGYGDDVLGGAQDSERARLAAMAAVCDPTTARVLDDLGVGPGWRCLEVGAGAGTVATWLAGRVRPAGGHVVATDIDPRPLDDLAGPNLTVLHHDITCDPQPPGGPFDLVHARFVLEHLPAREEVLDRLVAWLAPGGVIVVESIAGFPVGSSPHPAFRRAMHAVEDVLAVTIGTDATWGRRFPAPLLDRGLLDVGLTVSLPATGGANASALCWALTLSRLRPHILEHQLVAADVLDEALDLLADPGFFDLAAATAIAWGRRPPAAPTPAV